ncbi:MAG: hypothetical protein ACI837_002980 [Crocinitomicaceae bacterium]|jgi:hypothetical protein
MRALFQDKDLQSKFEEDGYVKLPLLSNAEVDHLLSYYQAQNFDNKIEGGFHISLDNKNSDLVSTVGEEIKKILVPKSEEIIDKGQVFTASFVIKEPGLQNIVPPHQDWTFVDETQFSSLTMWTPLVDVTEKNGALGVIRGSHKIFNHQRSSPSPQSKSPLADHIFTLFPYVEIVEMKAGETLIFNNKLIHASPPNLSDQARIAVGIGITQEEAKLRHYYHLPKSEPAQLEIYEVEKEFYTRYNNASLSELFEMGDRPRDLKILNTINREVPNLSKEEMTELVQSLGLTVNQPLMDKLAKLFDHDPKSTKANKEDMANKSDTRSSNDDRSFFQKYSPMNILREIKWRFGGRK